MVFNLTPRQQMLLKAIITEFIETGEAVGSLNLIDKYNLDISSATIRNEMANLVNENYLYMKHSSGGRIPTTKGWRFFVSSLPQNLQDNIDVSSKTQFKNKLVKIGSEDQLLIKESIHFLNRITGNTAIALIDNNVFYAGLSDIVTFEDFDQLKKIHRILEILEDYSALSKMFTKKEAKGNPPMAEIDDDISIIIGEESGIDEFEDYSVIFTELNVDNRKGYIGLVGPNRLRYQHIIPAVKYVANSLRNIINK